VLAAQRALAPALTTRTTDHQRARGADAGTSSPPHCSSPASPTQRTGPTQHRMPRVLHTRGSRGRDRVGGLD
jgi:hypothetical protein